MKLVDLSEATRQKIAKVRYDQIVEKHEGPFDWDCILDDPEPFFSSDPKSVSEIDSLKDSILSEHDTISPIEGTL
jgi:hypothetical protein